MAELIAIASGKGGVGKSFISSSLAMAFNELGRKTLLVDADLGGANLHNFLGYKVPPLGIYNFLREKLAIEDIVTSSPVGVDFIAGSGDILGMAHITAIERSRFIDKLRAMDYSYVLLDLGAGTSYNMVDFFNLADHKLVVMNSEPTSIENAYGFIKVSVYRYIERYLSSDSKFDKICRQLRSKSQSYPGIDGIIAALQELDRSVAQEISTYVNLYKCGIILNLVRYKKELNIFYGFDAIAKKYLRIKMEKLGFVPYDAKISESVRLMKPYYYNNKDSDISGCINDICEKIMQKKLL